MHELFAKVLSKKDLSRAGELFSLEDQVIEDDLANIVLEIQKIADTADYEKNDNDQSVVEICITRITTAIRDTSHIENHAQSLVGLLQMCHRHNLTQAAKDEDPPHAKIVSDVMSRLFTYYSNPQVMGLVIPSVVVFLDCQNKDLVRSVASYLSLAAIDNASLLAQHMSLILDSVLIGNHLLGQVIPEIFQQNPEPVLKHVDELAALMDKCENSDKMCFIQLFYKVAKTNPGALEKHVGQLCGYLSSSMVSPMVLNILVEISASKPEFIVSHIPTIFPVVDSQPMAMTQVARIAGSVGTLNEGQGKKSIDFLISKTSSTDITVLPLVLNEIRALGQLYPEVLVNNLGCINKFLSSGSSAVRLITQQIREDARKHMTPSETNSAQESFERMKAKSPNPTNLRKSDSATSEVNSEDTFSVVSGSEKETASVKEMRSVSSQTEGTVTIITVGNPPNAKHPSGTVSVKSTTLPRSGSSSQQSLTTKAQRNSGGEANHSSVLTQTSTTTTPADQDFGNKSEHMRDGVQLFCEKHFTKIKNFICKLNVTLPLPVKCGIVSGKHKRYLKLQYECARHSEQLQCLYARSYFNLSTKLPKVWIHLMFLSVQAKAQFALSQRDSDVCGLKECFDALQVEGSGSFLALVTSSFPTQKDQAVLLQELHQSRYFDVFEFNATKTHWACFVCNHPEKMSELLTDGCPQMAGQLKEKKGKWKFFKRWKTRYFTLSGGSFTYSKGNSTKSSLPVTKIQSVKAVRKGIRDIPKAFEIFTDDQTYVFKAKGHQDVEQWIQCLHIAVARSQGESPPASDANREGDDAATVLLDGAHDFQTSGADVSIMCTGGCGTGSKRKGDKDSAYAGGCTCSHSQLSNPPAVQSSGGSIHSRRMSNTKL